MPHRRPPRSTQAGDTTRPRGPLVSFRVLFVFACLQSSRGLWTSLHKQHQNGIWGHHTSCLISPYCMIAPIRNDGCVYPPCICMGNVTFENSGHNHAMPSSGCQSPFAYHLSTFVAIRIHMHTSCHTPPGPIVHIIRHVMGGSGPGGHSRTGGARCLSPRKHLGPSMPCV